MLFIYQCMPPFVGPASELPSSLCYRVYFGFIRFQFLQIMFNIIIYKCLCVSVITHNIKKTVIKSK